MAVNLKGLTKNLTGTSGLKVGGLLSGNPSISGNFNNLLKKDKIANNPNTPLKELYEPESENTLQYPMDLDDNHYLLFNVKKRVEVNKKNFYGNDPETNTNTLQTIVLPLPLNLRDDRSVNYNNVNLGVVGGKGAGLASFGDLYQDLGDTLYQFGGKALDTIMDGSIIDTIGKQIREEGVLKGITTAAVTTGGLAALNKMGIGAITGGAAALKFGQGLFFSSGLAFNPRMATTFDGVNFREFQFSYRLIARNPEESEQIQEIVKAFQYHSLPSYQGASRSGFNYPDEFQLEFASAIKGQLFDFQPAVLKSVGVSYNTDSGPAFFEGTNQPILIDLALNFQEVRILTKETFDGGIKVELTPDKSEKVAEGE